MPRGKEPLPLVFDGPQWTDVSVSDIPELPKLPKHFTLSNPQFLARSHHSQVYLLDITDHGKTFRAVLKLFPKQLKQRYVNEVNAYRFLCHYGVPDQGIVPKVYGVLPSLSKKALSKLLGDSIPEEAPVVGTAAAVVMEYIQGAQKASPETMTPTLAKKAVDALRTIHKAHILHEDAEGRNLLVFPETEQVVWIDFSSATVNRDVLLALSELNLLKELLYRKFV